MGRLVRFGVSIDAGLLKGFDRRNARKGYANRSEAIRDLVRDVLVGEVLDADRGETVGVVSMVYDHHRMEMPKHMADVQHRRHSLIVATTHVHLDAHNCLEVLILRGRAEDVRHLGDRLVSMRGVKHGKMFLTTTGKHLT